MQIVLVSPFAVERDALKRHLEEDGHEVIAVQTRDDALRTVAAAMPDAVVADAQVAAVDGHAFVRALTAHRPLRVILLCPRAARDCGTGRVPCLTKPIDLDDLRRYLSGPPVARSLVA